MAGFQKQVNITPAIAVAGDFASANPRASVVAPEGGFVSDAGGVTVGRFAWISSGGVKVSNAGQGKPNGFVHREQQALITAYLAESGNLIQAGREVTLMRTGDYFTTANDAAAVLNNKVYAKFQDGSTRFAASGAPPQAASITAAQNTTTLTVSAIGSGALSVGDLVTQASGTPAYIMAQLTGTAGSTGTYTLSVSQSVPSGAATATSYVETDFVCSRACLTGELAAMSF